MADNELSKVLIGTVTYNLKDAKGRQDLIDTAATLSSAITAEAEARATADSGLDTRIKALESKGRFLSTWDATTGKPDTYPELSQLVEGKYNYRAGDYYIVNKVAAENNLMPDGKYISYDSATTTWTVPSTAFTGSTLNLGDQFQFDGTKWTYIASATTVAFKNIQGDAMDNDNLKGYLDTKEDKSKLKALAYKDSASGSYTPAGSINKINVTAAGTITVATLTQTLTGATITAKAAYKPAGTVTINGDAIKGGSITVTVKDASAASEASLTTATYTPTGTIAAKATDGSFSALKSAIFQESEAEGAVQIGGTISAPTITVNDSAKDTFVKSLKAGNDDAASIDTTKFDGGSFTGATQAEFTQGAKASFTQGAKASLTDQSKGSFAKKVLKPAIASDDAECLVFNWVDATDAGESSAFADAVTDRGTFTANGDDQFTANGDDTFTANNVGTFTAAAINDGFFSAKKIPVVDGTATAVTGVSATADAPLFTGKKYNLDTTADTALKNVEFTATNSAQVVNKVEYFKQEINTATFTPEATTITAEFEGTNVDDLIPTEIKYNQAEQAGATFNAETKEVTPEFTGTAATITVE